MKSRKQKSTQKPRDPDFAGAEIAMRRAAKRARERAKETARIAAANKGSAGAGEIHGTDAGRDPREQSSGKAT